MRYSVMWLGASLLAAVGALQAKEPPVIPFCDELEGATNMSFCLSRDGKKVALTNCKWIIWDVPTGKRLVDGKFPGIWASAFSPNGDLLAVGGNYSWFRIYDALTGKEFWDLTLKGHGDTILNHIEFAPDGRRLVSSSVNNMLRVWDVHDKKALALFCFTSKYESLNTWKEYIRAWRTLAGDAPPDAVKVFIVFKTPIERIYSFSLSPDGKSVAVALGTPDVLILELETGKVLKELHTDQVSNLSIRYSADGKFLVVGGGDEEEDTGKCTIELWDVAASKRISTCPGHRHSVMHVAISPDNKTIVSGGMKDGFRVWDAATGKQKFALHQGRQIRSAGVEFLPDGKTFLAAPCPEDGDPTKRNVPIDFRDAATGEPVSPIGKNGSK